MMTKYSHCQKISLIADNLELLHGYKYYITLHLIREKQLLDFLLPA